MEFVITNKGQQKLCYQGYLYIRQKDLANGAVAWECDKRRRESCTARLKVRGEELIAQLNEHNHGPDASRKQVLDVKATIKRRALDTEETPQQIISTAVANVTESAAAQLPPIRHIKRGIRRYKNNAGHALPIPPTPQTMVIPEKYKVTNSDEPFLLYDSGIDSPNRMLIFSTETNLRALTTTGHWFADGTFKVAPELFYQVFTIHALVDNNIMPCVYALLPNKNEDTYYELFNQLLQLKPTLHPRSMMFDFEVASRNALLRVFPDVDIKGCFFHLAQCVYRRVQDNGLQARYRDDQDFNLDVKMIPALAFVPADDVEEAFESLVDHISADAQPILDYFEDTFIGRPGRRNRRGPVFSLGIWNMFDRTVQELPRTNNNIEGWHRGFQSSVGGCHPNIWKFLEALKKHQALQQVALTQIMAGDEIVQRRKYRDCARRILHIVEHYNDRHILDYLRGLAHNIHM